MSKPNPAEPSLPTLPATQEQQRAIARAFDVFDEEAVTQAFDLCFWRHDAPADELYPYDERVNE